MSINLDFESIKSIIDGEKMLSARDSGWKEGEGCCCLRHGSKTLTPIPLGEAFRAPTHNSSIAIDGLSATGMFALADDSN